MTYNLDSSVTGVTTFTSTAEHIINASNIELNEATILTHTATESDDHALEIDCDAASFGDVKALDIDFISGAIQSGTNEEAVLVNIDESASTGGRIVGYEVVSTTVGNAVVDALEVGVGIHPILQQSGTFGNATLISIDGVDKLTDLSSGGAGNIPIFVTNTDFVTVGFTSPWSEMEVILRTGASGAGIKSTFEFSDSAVPTYTTFSPSDGTNAFKNTGVILWELSDIPGWTSSSGNYLIRITRTRNILTISPIADLIQVSAVTDYTWDKDGVVSISSLILHGATSGTTTLIAPAVAGTTSLQLPVDQGIVDFILRTNGSGVTTWTAQTDSTNGLPTGYISGFVSNWDGNSTVTITAGVCRDIDDTHDIIHTGTLTPNVTMSGVNGLDTGSETDDTWYSVWVIADDADVLVVASLLSISVSAPTLPSGYDVKRRVGWTRNKPGNFLQSVTQNTSRDRLYQYNENGSNVQVLNNGTATTPTNVDLSSLVPPTSTLAYLNLQHQGLTAAANDGVRIRYDGSAQTTTITRAMAGGSTDDVTANVMMHMRTSTSQVIEYDNINSGDETNIWVVGYTDSI